MYDTLAPWGEPDDRFYFPLVMAAASVLDVGCGAGQLLRAAREAGQAGRLRGLDPAPGMLEWARVRDDIAWTLGDLSTIQFDREFDLIVMTGHAFQVLLTDDQLRAALAAVRSALTEGGRFAFETRNPAARAWERWTPDHAVSIVAPSGELVRVAHAVALPVADEFVSFTTTYSSPQWDREETNQSTLRFLNAATLASFLSEAGLTIEEQYGDWDRSPLDASSPEIITIARRAD